MRNGTVSQMADGMKSERPSLLRLLSDRVGVDIALMEGVQEAMRRHVDANAPMAVWEEGRPVWVGVEKINRWLSSFASARPGDCPPKPDA